MILPVKNLLLNSWYLLEICTAKNTKESANMLIFSNIPSSTSAYKVFAKDPLDIYSTIDYNINVTINIINNNNSLNLFVWSKFFCVLSRSAEQECKQALACFNIRPSVPGLNYETPLVFNG